MLGVGFEASEDEIRNAYRRLAMRWHPDRHCGGQGGVSQAEATERFKLIGEAYHVLGDPERREWYNNNAEIDVSELNLDEFLTRFKEFVLTNQWLDCDVYDKAAESDLDFGLLQQAPRPRQALAANALPHR